MRHRKCWKGVWLIKWFRYFNGIVSLNMCRDKCRNVFRDKCMNSNVKADVNMDLNMNLRNHRHINPSSITATLSQCSGSSKRYFLTNTSSTVLRQLPMEFAKP